VTAWDRRSTFRHRSRPDRAIERDACGIGFVADATGRADRRIVDLALGALARVRHRGAVAADRQTADGAGVLLPIPPALLPRPWCGLAMVFLRDEHARAAIEQACEAHCPRVAQCPFNPNRA
jgi:glutamate synthase domain-containing protein 1